MMWKNNEDGFTLVELSIVLVIVGLLIGGILAGRSMITTARDQSIIRDMEKYRIAIRLFENQYGYLPGTISTSDYQHWSGSWPGVENGFSMFAQMNNMGMLDQKYDSSILSSGYGVDTSPQNWPGKAIPKVSNGAAVYGTSQDLETGSDLGTGSFLGTPMTAITCANYNFLRIGNYTATQAVDISPAYYYQNGAIDPVDAQAIDTKIDDGNGSTGQVISEGQTTIWNQCKTGPYVTGGSYQPISNVNACLIYFCAETNN